MLAKMDASNTIAALTQRALFDADDNVRDKSLAYLVEQGNQQSVRFFVQRLEDKDNQTINRAAAASPDPGTRHDSAVDRGAGHQAQAAGRRRGGH